MRRWLMRLVTVLVTLVISYGLVSASTGLKTLEVIYRDIKLVVRGNTVTPKEEPFIYNGTTYIPLRAVAEALGEEVKWDGATSTIYVGGFVPGQIGLADLQPYYGHGSVTVADQVVVASKTYQKAMWNDCGSKQVKWNLDGKYSRLSGWVGLIDGKNTRAASLVIWGDGEKLAEVKMQPGEFPKPIEISLKGVLQLTVLFDNHPYYCDSAISLASAVLTP